MIRALAKQSRWAAIGVVALAIASCRGCGHPAPPFNPVPEQVQKQLVDSLAAVREVPAARDRPPMGDGGVLTIAP